MNSLECFLNGVIFTIIITMTITIIYIFLAHNKVVVQRWLPMESQQLLLSFVRLGLGVYGAGFLRPDLLRVAKSAASDLSLIHISEPTRPY